MQAGFIGLGVSGGKWGDIRWIGLQWVLNQATLGKWQCICRSKIRKGQDPKSIKPEYAHEEASFSAHQDICYMNSTCYF